MSFLLLCFGAVALTQSLTDAQKLEQAVSLAQSVVCESDTCKTRQKDVVTRLTNLKFYLPATTPVPPPPPPVYATVTMLDALAARVAKLEAVPVPVPTPTPTPTPVPVPSEICGNGLDDDKDGQADEGCIVLPPPSGEANAYADALCRQTGATCYRLQTQAEIDQYRHGRGMYGPRVDYDPQANAAKWQWVSNDLSAENIRLPIQLDRPATGSSKLLIISDHRWDKGWLTEFKDARGIPLGGWKWLQVTSGASPTNARQAVWFEPQMRGIGDNTFSSATPPALSLFSARQYFGVVAPTTPTASACGINFGESIGPMLNCFKAHADTWTRVWIEIELKAGEAFATISWWMADEEQDALPILRGVQQFAYPPIREFWFEYNTSADGPRLGGPMTAWGRNVVVLKDVDATTTFARPVR